MYIEESCKSACCVDMARVVSVGTSCVRTLEGFELYGVEVWLRVCVAWILYMRGGVCEVRRVV